MQKVLIKKDEQTSYIELNIYTEQYKMHIK